MSFCQSLRKIKLLYKHNWYRTMSGGWRDSHMMGYISKQDFRNMTLDELRKAVSHG